MAKLYNSAKTKDLNLFCNTLLKVSDVSRRNAFEGLLKLNLEPCFYKQLTQSYKNFKQGEPNDMLRRAIEVNSYNAVVAFLEWDYIEIAKWRDCEEPVQSYLISHPKFVPDKDMLLSLARSGKPDNLDVVFDYYNGWDPVSIAEVIQSNKDRTTAVVMLCRLDCSLVSNATKTHIQNRNRDLKPDNILLHNGDAKIIDFNLSDSIDNNPHSLPVLIIY